MYRYSDCYDRNMSEPKPKSPKSLDDAQLEYLARAAREWRGDRTQDEVAVLLETKQGQVSALEAGKGVGILTLSRLSKVTGRTMNDLLGVDYPNINERLLRLLVTKTDELMVLFQTDFSFGGKKGELIQEIRRLASDLPWRLAPHHAVSQIEAGQLPKEHHQRHRAGLGAPKSRRKTA